MEYYVRNVVLWTYSIVLALSIVFNAQAANEASRPGVATEQAHQLTASDVEAFLDGLVPLQLETNDIAGAVVSIVKDGKVLFAKGYGLSDVESGRPVNPDTTLFRIGSVTKLFTWTAVMQLVDQGRLDLDTDVNTYLDFEIPPAFSKPVTLRNLMTHRAGFEEAIKNLGAQNAGRADLTKYLKQNIPARIFEPGTTAAYSNYGAALAGYVVERVSGEKFDAYVEKNIFAPLGMSYSTLRQPVPAPLSPGVSKGYSIASETAKDFEIVNGYPAGSQSSSAADIAKFMIAHLTADKSILRPATYAIMHNTVAKSEPRQNGIALGFYEESSHGLRIIGHGGDTMYFHSDLHLVPNKNLGFFVSYNSQGRGDTPPRTLLWKKFLERYFPHTESVTEVKRIGLSAQDVTGSYLVTRRAESGMLKVLMALGQLSVTANEDGSITVDTFIGPNGRPRKWTWLGDGEFKDENGTSKIVFSKDKNGTLKMYASSAGIMEFERTEFPRKPTVLLLVLVGSIVIVALNLLGLPVAAGVRRHYGAELGWGLWENFLRFGTLAASTALLAFVLGIFAIFIPKLTANVWALDGSDDQALHLLQQLGIVGAWGSIVALVNAGYAWFNPVRGFFGRLKETALALACLGLIWLAYTMNFFDPALRY